jgi:hypothetical protein
MESPDQSKRIPVEVLSSPSCPGRSSACEAVRRVAAGLGLEVELRERELTTEAEARALRMPGSPTVRIGGTDVEAEAELRDDFGLG